MTSKLYLFVDSVLSKVCIWHGFYNKEFLVYNLKAIFFPQYLKKLVIPGNSSYYKFDD